jgi:hypothetical protein
MGLTAFVQTANPAESAAGRADVRGQLADQILAAQTQHGPHSAALIELFTALGVVYAENGNYTLAIAALEQAQQVVRANYGLRSLDQLPLIRQKIRHEELRGKVVEAWDLEAELLALARANAEDVRAASVFRELGDKRMELLDRYLAGELPPQIILGCYYSRPQVPAPVIRNCSAGSKRVAAQSILREAQDHYVAAIDVLARNALESSDEGRALELDLLRSSFTHGTYETGRASLARLISHEASPAKPLAARAAALVQVADWDLLFEESAKAIAEYEELYALLSREGVPQATLDEVFSPAVPVVLPTFLSNPLVTDASKATGYVDVSFEITRFGSSRRIEILDSTDVSSAAQARLTKLIAKSPFRPRTTNGEFGRTSRVMLRYFVNE